jgi:hypothetical protein
LFSSARGCFGVAFSYFKRETCKKSTDIGPRSSLENEESTQTRNKMHSRLDNTSQSKPQYFAS